MKSSSWILVALSFICVSTAGVKEGSSTLEARDMLTISSSAFGDGESIPVKYTCEGENISPPLVWTGVPSDAKSLVLIVDDPDAPDPKAPRTTWIHWVVYNLPPDSEGIVEGAQAANLPTGTEVGLNDWKKPSYGGPCPPIGRHRYFHKLYALDTMLTGLREPTKADIETAMKDHILVESKLMGTYEKIH